jgi:cytochrome c biogenesis protein CcmG/thiol:disulfide interchange protein DsbE
MKIRLILISLLLSYCSSTGINQEVIQITNLNINSLQNLDSDNETNLDSEFLIINYWASWCLECIEEHDLLISLNQIESFNGKVVLISFQDNVSNSLDFLNKYGYGDLIYLIDNKSEFAINSGVFGVPETHIIKEGKIIKKYIGPLSFSDVEEIIILYS